MNIAAMEQDANTSGIVNRAAVDLLAELTAMGFEVRTAGDSLVVAGQQSELGEEMRARIRANKNGLLQLVRALETDVPDGVGPN